MSNTLSCLIRECVLQVGDPLLRHIIEYVDPHGYSVEDVRKEVERMIECGELRMKEDLIDHEWSYRKGKNW